MKLKNVLLTCFFLTLLVAANAQVPDRKIKTSKALIGKIQPEELQYRERYVPKPYVPESIELYKAIVRMDSLYFDTYNHCDLDKMNAMMSDDLEFYHDRNGLSTSKKEVMEGIKKYICGKVTRTLAKGSIEVYPIKDFGAVEIGYHSFRNNTEPGESTPSKFIIFWKLKDGDWKITRVVSLH